MGKTRPTLTHCFLRSGCSCRLGLSSENADTLPPVIRCHLIRINVEKLPNGRAVPSE